jgi:ribosomal protein S10
MHKEEMKLRPFLPSPHFVDNFSTLSYEHISHRRLFDIADLRLPILAHSIYSLVRLIDKCLIELALCIWDSRREA